MMLLKRRSSAKRLYRQLLDELEPLNQRLKEEEGIPRNDRILLWDVFLFKAAIRMYTEGLNCYIARCFEASAVMCRNAIDSAIYLDWAYVHTKGKIGFKQRQAAAQIKKTHWASLRQHALELSLLTESEIKHVEEVRERGNFSAHYAEKRNSSRREWEINEYLPVIQKWRKENETQMKKGLENLASIPMPIFRSYWKPWTSQEEALTTLAETKDILKKIISNYFSSEKTLDGQRKVSKGRVKKT